MSEAVATPAPAAPERTFYLAPEPPADTAARETTDDAAAPAEKAAPSTAPAPAAQPTHDYFADLPRGITVGEDAPIVRGFLDVAHKHSVPKEAAYEILQWHQAEQANSLAELARFDQAAAAATSKQMREKWTTEEFGTTVSLIRSYLHRLPFGSAILNARLDDGTALCNSPAALEWLANLARRPSTPLKEGLTAAQGLAEINRVMRDDRGAYNKDLGMQARYRDLIRADAGQQEAPRENLSHAEHQELAGIERVMREDRRSYNRERYKRAIANCSPFVDEHLLVAG